MLEKINYAVLGYESDLIEKIRILNYNQLDDGQKALMISLKNHVESLCLLMKKKVEL